MFKIYKNHFKKPNTIINVIFITFSLFWVIVRNIRINIMNILLITNSIVCIIKIKWLYFRVSSEWWHLGKDAVCCHFICLSKIYCLKKLLLYHRINLVYCVAKTNKVSLELLNSVINIWKKLQGFLWMRYNIAWVIKIELYDISWND